MTRHAAAFVKWDTFRPSGGTGGAAVYDYGSDQQQLVEKVAGGGTLWLITSTKRGAAAPRRYHLAYKLVDCAQVDRFESIFSGKWKYVVRARDWRRSRHFRFNDATTTLRGLRFASGKSMSEAKNVGTRLLSIPELTAEDVLLLDRLQHKIEEGRAAFVSYSRTDADLAARLEAELGERDISVSRDVAFLQPGQEWEEALRTEVTGTDCFLVLIGKDSADRPWVRQEVEWALRELEAGGLVRVIVPVVLPNGDWARFPELHRFERWDYPTAGNEKSAFDRLARGMVRARPS